MTPYERVLAALKARNSRRVGNNWQCPSHNDRNPSLSVNEHADGSGAVLMYCHAGCSTTLEICPALGIEPADLFPGNGNGEQRQLFPLSKYSPVGLDILLRLPSDSSRSFVVASALGRYLSITGGREYVHSQRRIAAVIVESKHRKAILSVLGISKSQLSNQIKEWRARGCAHACTPRVFTILVRDVRVSPLCRCSLLNEQTTSNSSLLNEQVPPGSSLLDEQIVSEPVITSSGFFKELDGDSSSKAQVITNHAQLRVLLERDYQEWKESRA
jgi:hypothetical protein